MFNNGLGSRIPSAYCYWCQSIGLPVTFNFPLYLTNNQFICHFMISLLCIRHFGHFIGRQSPGCARDHSSGSLVQSILRDSETHPNFFSAMQSSVDNLHSPAFISLMALMPKEHICKSIARGREKYPEAASMRPVGWVFTKEQVCLSNERCNANQCLSNALLNKFIQKGQATVGLELRASTVQELNESGKGACTNHYATQNYNSQVERLWKPRHLDDVWWNCEAARAVVTGSNSTGSIRMCRRPGLPSCNAWELPLRPVDALLVSLGYSRKELEGSCYGQTPGLVGVDGLYAHWFQR
ncbi:hypothetical protein DFH09DRAFT_1074793 [Mycena vulgaris]|nr:hypothetical protein DFH09DRAFT_1074793 [Mycena vulgaris]